MNHETCILVLNLSLLRNLFQRGAVMREVVQEAERSGIGGGSAEHKDAPALSDVASLSLLHGVLTLR